MSIARPLAVIFDCGDPGVLAGFWQALIGGTIEETTKSSEWVALEHVPVFGCLGFQRVPEDKAVKNRVHLDLDVADILTAVAHSTRLGASAVGDTVEEPTNSFQAMTDPEGNEFCFVRRKREPQMPLVDDVGRPEPDPDVDEVETLIGFLDFQRATLEWKARGLDSAGLNAISAASTMTLGGLLKHMTWVEDHWFSHWLMGRPRSEPWASIDWSANPDWEWTSSRDDDPDALRMLWSSTCDTSRANVAGVLSRGDLGTLASRTWPSGEAPSLRWIMVHMIEEYARHNGHADLLREAVDGQTGE